MPTLQFNNKSPQIINIDNNKNKKNIFFFFKTNYKFKEKFREIPRKEEEGNQCRMALIQHMISQRIKHPNICVVISATPQKILSKKSIPTSQKPKNNKNKIKITTLYYQKSTKERHTWI